jgi:hypothetical protein
MQVGGQFKNKQIIYIYVCVCVCVCNKNRRIEWKTKEAWDKDVAYGPQLFIIHMNTARTTWFNSY